MRLYRAPAIGSGATVADAVRPAVPAAFDGVCYRSATGFLVITSADLTAVAGVTELVDADAIATACASVGIEVPA